MTCQDCYTTRDRALVWLNHQLKRLRLKIIRCARDLVKRNLLISLVKPGVINEMFDVIEDESKQVELRLKNPILTKRIVKHWDTIQRIALSLNQRKITQATLVRKLSGYKKNHPLLEALIEYNRMKKATYLLNYIDDAKLLDYVQRALNRGETYHQLRRAVSQVNGGLFRGSSDEEMHVWNGCARLVTNAIIYFNSSILSRLLSSFEYQHDTQKIEIVKRASPVA